MKRELRYMLILPLLALCGCSGEEDAASIATQQPDETLQISVSAGEFSVVGSPDTRATDNGAVTTFESGDRVGVIIRDGSNQLLANNIPYIYNGSQWTFDATTASNEGTNKQLCYNDYIAEQLTYIVYYPYSASADGVTNKDRLKEIFAPKLDQKLEEDYRSSDLMVWTSESTSPLKELTATLSHAYASISFLFPTVKSKLADGNNTEVSYVPSGISDVNFTIGDVVYSSFHAADGSFRCILPAGFTGGNIRNFCILRNETYGNTLAIANVAPNTRYIFTQTLEDWDTFGLDRAQVGDFYCMNNSNEGYLIPGEVASLDDGINCIGIVYWVGDGAINDDVLLKEQYSGCTHGLVVGLHELGGMHWSEKGGSIQNWINKEGNPYKGRVNTREEKKLCGYSNTVAMTDYNNGGGTNYPSVVVNNNNYRVQPCDAINEYAKTHSTPTASSGWYFPSICSLKNMCWGQGNGEGVVGRDLLNRQIGKVSSKLAASSFLSSFYWSSTESTTSYEAFDVDFGSGYTYISYKYDFDDQVRAVLAF